MERKLIDANVILRYLLRDDEGSFKKASALLEKVKKGEEIVVIPESVIAECVYVLLKIYHVDRETIAEKLRGLLSYKGIANSDRIDLIEAITLFGQSQISIVDCILCSKSVNQGMILFTFDDELENIYKKCISSKRVF